MIDKLFHFLGTVALITIIALGTAFFASGEWEAWKAVRDARPDLAVAELRDDAAAREARVAALETSLGEALLRLAALEAAETKAAAQRAVLIETIEAVEMTGEIHRSEIAGALAEKVDAEALAAFPAWGDTIRLEPAAGGEPAAGAWKLMKADN